MDVSPDGTVCAVVHKNNLLIYNVCCDTLKYSLTNTSTSDTKTITSIKISPSNNEVAWLQSSSTLVLVHIDSKRRLKIGHQSDYGYSHIMWSPDGKHLAAFSCLSLFIDIYKIERDFSSSYHHSSISGTKVEEPPIAQFSPDSSYFATVNVCKQGHCITIYCTASWNCVQKLFDRVCGDIGGLVWCPDCVSLLVWQGRLGLCLRLWTVDGRVEHQLFPPTPSPPLRTVRLSSCGRTAILYSTDARIQVLDLLTWQLASQIELVHHPVIVRTSERSILRQLPDIDLLLTHCEPILERCYELSHDEATKHAALAELSIETRYLASYEPVYPQALWVWDLTADSPLQAVVVLSHTTCVKGLLWHKERTMLAATLTHGRVLVWTPEQCFIISHKKPWPLTAHTYFATLHLAKIE